MKYIYDSQRGKNRQNNQDSIHIVKNEDAYLFLLFDGVSSKEHSHILIKEFFSRIKVGFISQKKSVSALSELLFQSHKEVLELEIDGYSTLSVLYMDRYSGKVYILNIGDSRIYVFTNKFLDQVTNDDNIPGNKNVLTRYLGSLELERSDFDFSTFRGDLNYLLCTDGFYSIMENELMDYFKTFQFKRASNIKKKLNLLQARSNMDDSSYIIIKVK